MILMDICTACLHGSWVNVHTDPWPVSPFTHWLLCDARYQVSPLQMTPWLPTNRRTIYTSRGDGVAAIYSPIIKVSGSDRRPAGVIVPFTAPAIHLSTRFGPEGSRLHARVRFAF